MDIVGEAGAVLERELALVVGELRRPLVGCTRCFMSGNHAIELVKVAGIATTIHHTKPVRNSFPLPRTRLLTSLPSSSATYKLSSVRSTRKTLWLMSSLISLLRHPGMTIFNSRSRFLKNSRLSSTFFLTVASPSPGPIPGRRRASACRADAAFCSEMALRMRLMRATKRVRYTARDILVRCWR